jgi:hypothetical protein
MTLSIKAFFFSVSLLLLGNVLLSLAKNCHIEKGYSYDSFLNDTSLLKCNELRNEKICIIGGGLSAVHMGWLLKRRGEQWFRPIMIQNSLLFLRLSEYHEL